MKTPVIDFGTVSYYVSEKVLSVALKEIVVYVVLLQCWIILDNGKKFIVDL